MKKLFKRSQVVIAAALSLTLFVTLSCETVFPTSQNENNTDLAVLSALAGHFTESPSPHPVGTIRFSAELDGREITCGSQVYNLPSGQSVQIRDFRFFVQDIQLIRNDGTKIVVAMENVDQYQIREGSHQVALLDFSRVGQGKCTGTSDNDSVWKQITARFPQENYKGFEITIGVPGALNHRDFSQQPATSPLRAATGMTWSWLAGYKFLRVELESSTATTRMVVHLGSTNCTGDTSIAFGNPGGVSCANPYRATYRIEPTGGYNPNTDTITVDASELFRGNGGVPTAAFQNGTDLSCMPIGNGTGTGGTPATCGPILKNLGIVPGTQAGFGSSLVTETNVGTVDTSTQQPFFKIVK